MTATQRVAKAIVVAIHLHIFDRHGMRNNALIKLGTMIP
jgi:hypothetical protein